MRTDAWISAHVGAFEHFGGVAQILVPDNASTATYRAKRGDAARFVTDRYRQMADHYGCAIVPAQQAGDRVSARKDVDHAGGSSMRRRQPGPAGEEANNA